MEGGEGERGRGGGRGGEGEGGGGRGGGREGGGEGGREGGGGGEGEREGVRDREREAGRERERERVREEWSTDEVDTCAHMSAGLSCKVFWTSLFQCRLHEEHRRNYIWLAFWEFNTVNTWT